VAKKIIRTTIRKTFAYIGVVNLCPEEHEKQSTEEPRKALEPTGAGRKKQSASPIRKDEQPASVKPLFA